MNPERFFNDITRSRWNVYGVEVYKDGRLAGSFGDTGDGIYDIYSAAKSIVSVAVGIAYDRGLLGLDAPVLRYLPAERTASLPRKQRETFASLTVERLLTMSVGGFPFRPEGDDYLDFCLNCNIPDPAERTFNYSNVPVYLICAALQQVFGEDLGEFIENRVLEPLGITKYEYSRSPEGIFYGASKMKLSVNGLSRIGMLMMNGGTFGGERIVSEDYVRLATSVRQMNREGGYGFFFWKYRNGFSINGKWKQKCYCLPKRGLMVTYLSHIEDDSHDLLNSTERNIFDIAD